MSEENINIQQSGEENQPETEQTPKPKLPRNPIRVSLTTLICSIVAVAIAAVMVTSTLLASAYQKKVAEIKTEGSQTGEQIEQGSLAYDLKVLEALFGQLSFAELNSEQLRTLVLKAYAYATGDKYAEYYTNEEFEALTADLGGQSQGIGINIISTELDVEKIGYSGVGLKVINVTKGSPAEEKGLLIGDVIIAVGTEEENQRVSALGEDAALAALQGVKDTTAEFLVYRASEEKVIPFSIMRKEFTSDSVIYKKADGDVGKNIGVVKIIEFDKTTPTQVVSAIEALKGEGCDKFVFDVRYNPGGSLDSILAVLSLFLDEGDVIMTEKNKAGNETVRRVEVIDPLDSSSAYYANGVFDPSSPNYNSELSFSRCTVKKSDIGKYKDLNMVVLCNESTASAAELFVANFRDHSLGEIVGTKTYGKGSMQTYIDLSAYGCIGWLKLTVAMYYPPNGEGYDGIGIEPTSNVPVSEEAAKQNIYDIMGTSNDNQLVAAVDYLKK